MLDCRSSRSRRGQQTVEVACALVILVVFVLVPLINIGVVPLRFELARRVVGGIAKRLAVSEKFSDAFKTVNNGADELNASLRAIGGVRVNSAELSLSVTSSSSPDVEQTVDKPGKIPAEWLPNGSKAPCNYFLHLKVDTSIDPLMTAKIAGQSFPALNGPVNLTIEEVAHWENLGRDPTTQEFYVNE